MIVCNIELRKLKQLILKNYLTKKNSLKLSFKNTNFNYYFRLASST